MKKLALAALVLATTISTVKADNLIPNNVWGQNPHGPRAVVAPLGWGVNSARPRAYARPVPAGRRICIAWPCY